MGLHCFPKFNNDLHKSLPAHFSRYLEIRTTVAGQSIVQEILIWTLISRRHEKGKISDFCDVPLVCNNQIITSYFSVDSILQTFLNLLFLLHLNCNWVCSHTEDKAFICLVSEKYFHKYRSLKTCHKPTLIRSLSAPSVSTQDIIHFIISFMDTVRKIRLGKTSTNW